MSMIIGITGQSGSGKTTAAKIFESYGFYHLNCDRLVHEKVHKLPAVLSKIQSVFGDGYVKDGAIQKKRIAELVFSNKNAYSKLNEIFVPEVKKAIDYELSVHRNDNILLDAPLLFEYSLDRICDVTVGVVSNKAAERICRRDGITETEALARLSNQKSIDYFYENCDFVIENNGTVEELKKSICKIINAVNAGA